MGAPVGTDMRVRTQIRWYFRVVSFADTVCNIGHTVCTTVIIR